MRRSSWYNERHRRSSAASSPSRHSTKSPYLFAIFVWVSVSSPSLFVADYSPRAAGRAAKISAR